MSLFENFPYTNLHNLNLDWLIQEMKDLEQKVQDGPVISVNGLTGEVILYRQPNVQLPDVNDPTVTHWEIFRYLNGNIYGIQFDNNGNVYALRDFVRTKLLTWDDIPPEAGVITVNGLYGVVHLSGTDIPYMGGETETVYDKLSDLDDAVTSAQADINDMMITFTTVDNAIKSGLVYFEAEDTAVNNIASGKYVFWKNGAYVASTAISAGDTLSTTNLTAVGTGGIINALKADLQNQIDTINSNINGIKNAKDLGTVSSLSTLQTVLATEASLMPTSGVEPIEVYCNPAFETFIIARYIGQLRTNYNNGTRIDFTVTLTSAYGDAITISRLNDVWYYTDLNSNIESKDLNKNATVSNCNDDLANGVYQITSTTQNAPIGGGLLFNLNGRNGLRIQIAGFSNHMYFRNYGTAWSEWRDVTSTAV